MTRGVDGFGNAYGDYENGSVQLEPSSRDVSLASLEMNVDLGFATLTSSTSHYEHEGDSVSENTGFYAQAGSIHRTWKHLTKPQKARLFEAYRTWIAEYEKMNEATIVKTWRFWAGCISSISPRKKMR